MISQFVKLIVDRAVGHNGFNFNAASNDECFKLNQVGLWGAETGDVMGNGESYDGDGVGTNTSAEENHPYSARRQNNFGSLVHFH
ncbi:hypothetical protein GUITHDRAFT_150952 [Guillardia theta CCMP2712]|uniref:Uncharacterized protein n=1 Tax=Guillardia theta (strain CCMP2712) TaxID=905079 RepID=L1JT81_GUITC|nr:hypothetical protein GUITHDRAFT_150952 [Guillardia theta CCMP2712]EKX51652.1 hypothetical protein GUITHDRAFT_150952 [Guillardia theta CCMP2712]|eukprot:XP_005838632.1 hypothetical protein GUITHDRAFT_150952 [Guillardia theta CCMP2712]